MNARAVLWVILTAILGLTWFIWSVGLFGILIDSDKAAGPGILASWVFLTVLTAATSCAADDSMNG